MRCAAASVADRVRSELRAAGHGISWRVGTLRISGAEGRYSGSRMLSWTGILPGPYFSPAASSRRGSHAIGRVEHGQGARRTGEVPASLAGTKRHRRFVRARLAPCVPWLAFVFASGSHLRTLASRSGGKCGLVSARMPVHDSHATVSEATPRLEAIPLPELTSVFSARGATTAHDRRVRKERRE